jgi:antitoxin component of RelBE/YafQ-DinJ toxin-antitoxin module
MQQGATINVRLSPDLKQGGDRVLERAGISTSVLVRDLYSYLVREQKVPELATQPHDDERHIRNQRRREALAAVTGILDGEIDLDEVKAERLQRQTRLGVRA